MYWFFWRFFWDFLALRGYSPTIDYGDSVVCIIFKKNIYFLGKMTKKHLFCLKINTIVYIMSSILKILKEYW